MKKLKGTMQLSTVVSNREDTYISIQLTDETSILRFAEIKLSFEEFGKLLAHRAANIEYQIANTDKLGLTHEHKTLEFEFESDVNYKNRKNEAIRQVKKHVPDGWEPDNYFNSQDSFFIKDGKKMARTTIRRWV